MAIVTNTDFKGEFFIPNNKDGNAAPVAAPTVKSELELFIDKYERLLLIDALGVTLYDQLQADLPGLSIQKWKDLVNGKNYTINSKTYRWDGLKNILVPFIFTHYLRDDQSTYTTTGTVKVKAANADNYNPTPKYIKAFNTFRTSYQGEKVNNAPTVLVNSSGVYGLDYYGNKRSSIVSMYQYLTDQNVLNATDFPDFEFVFYEQQNSLGV